MAMGILVSILLYSFVLAVPIALLCAFGRTGFPKKKRIEFLNALRRLSLPFSITFLLLFGFMWLGHRSGYLSIRGYTPEEIQQRDIYHRFLSITRIAIHLTGFDGDVLHRLVALRTEGLEIREIDGDFHNLMYNDNCFLVALADLEEVKNGKSRVMFICDALSKEPGQKASGKVTTFVFADSIIMPPPDDASGYKIPIRAFQSMVPPVPGCIYHGDGGDNQGTVEYPEVARARFKIYYGNLYKELERLNFMVPVLRDFGVVRG